MLMFFYRILFLPVFLILLPYYGYRMWKRGGYLIDFKYRLGLLPIKKKSSKKRIWIQAVSVGEVKAIKKLINFFVEDGRFEIFLTTTSSTGYTFAKNLYANAVDFVGLFPWDFYLFSVFAWKRINPDVAILIEGELWPEHMQQAKIHKVPIFLVNARLSDKTYKCYLAFEAISSQLFDKITKIFVSNEDDHRRFVTLGVDKNKLQIAGNLKFDYDVDRLSREDIDLLKSELGFDGETRILLGSSTWPGEEEMLLNCFKKIRKNSSEKWGLLIVPRHAERRYEIANLLRKSKLAWHLRSSGKATKPIDICLADTTGELAYLTNIADISFIGKSLPPHNGGQSPLDAAACSVPIIYGNTMSNFTAICRSLERIDGAAKVFNHETAERVIVSLACDGVKRAKMSAMLLEWYKNNRGASEYTYKSITGSIFDGKRV